MNGKISDSNGALPGATIVAIHVPTGSQYANISDASGFYRIPNMKVGGPYKITVSFVGFEDFVKEDVYLQLGQRFKFNTELSETSLELAEVVVTAGGEIFDGNRTGSETIVGRDKIDQLPTVSRSIADFARLTPGANITEGSDGFSVSLGGINNRFNAIFIDGAVNNDVFGLSGSGTNGGQTGAAPISIDAIEQFQISQAPFDVRQSGFAGGSISAVTRSGTNEFEGSFYHLSRNEDLTGKTPGPDSDFVGGDKREKVNPFTAKTTGFRVGGPVIKNKLFFFFNAEFQRDETPQPFDIGGYQGDASANDLTDLSNFLKKEYKYDAGAYDNNTAFTNANRFLVKFNYNLGDNHKLSARHSYTSIDNLEAVQSNNFGIRFLNSSEFFPSVTNSTSLELKSALGNNMSNHLTIGLTKVVDDRDPSGKDFPYVRIDDGSGEITLGSERFSTANRLEQDIFTITDNLEIYKGKHTITLGTHNEFYKVYNLFIAFNFGSYEWRRSTPIGTSNLADFMNMEPSSFFIRNFSLRDDVTGDGSIAAAQYKGMQLGFYAQDEIQVNEKFKVTAGVRFDIPIWNDDTPANNAFNKTTAPLLEAEGYDLQGAETGSFIDPQVMFAPRVGFNFDVNGDQKIQLRGGIGIFNSRIPQVWPAGAYNNTGLNLGTDLAFGDRVFESDALNQSQSVQPGSGIPSGSIDLFAKDFKYPQVLKTNIAVDAKLPWWGLIGTVEYLHTSFLNNVAYQNLNLSRSTAKLTGTPDNRPIYDRADEVDPTYARILLGYNTDKGNAYTLTVQVTKPVENGLEFSAGYSYGDANSIFDGTSSQNSSQWRGLHSVRGRNFDQPLTRSGFSLGSRFFLQASYKKEYAGFASSQISFFYNGQSGTPFSYIYNDGGALNNEDSRERNLIFVPENQNDIILVDNGSSPQAQWNALDKYISNDEYLSSRRGQYAETNGSRSPFVGQLDMKFTQDFFIEMANNRRNIIQLTFDVFNLGNFLNAEWGRIKQTGSDLQLLNFEGFEDDGTTPNFSYDRESNLKDFLFFDDSGIRSSRWQMQVGIRYIFGN